MNKQRLLRTPFVAVVGLEPPDRNSTSVRRPAEAGVTNMTNKGTARSRPARGIRSGGTDYSGKGHMHKQALRAAVAAVCGLIALLAIVPAAHATNASVPPVKVDGNPKCADYGLTAIAKFDPVNSGTKDGITLTKHDTYYVKWTSTVAVDRVIVKGGPNANIYKYPADTYGDDWLHAPMNGSKPYGLSHVEFCSDGSKPPP